MIHETETVEGREGVLSGDGAQGRKEVQAQDHAGTAGHYAGGKKGSRMQAGEVYGRLTTIRRMGAAASGAQLWLCRCKCGTEKVVQVGNLRNGDTKSCGCYTRELTARLFTTHGMSGSAEYKTWICMKDRCTRPNNKDYRDYGGRGITVCERWIHSFENFLADMGNKPSKHHSIDRIDNDKGYEPGNCRWATQREQHNNRRSNVILEFNGIRNTVVGWTRALGFGEWTIYTRLKRGWPVDKTLTTPVASSGKGNSLVL